MKVIILGAGVIGVTTAYFLAEQGVEVVVLDREPEPAMECSFANGGQLSYSHMEPWANPAAVKKILSWIGRKDAPLIFRMRADLRQWLWGIEFLKHCTHKQSHETTRNMLRLSLYSKDVLADLNARQSIPFYHQKNGILHIFRTQEELELELKQAEYQTTLGCEYTELDRQGCFEKEPALKQSAEPIIGGIHFPQDESGNIYLFTKKLAEICETMGVKFYYNTTVEGLEVEGNRVTGVRYDGGGTITADKVVMALGAYSPVALKKTSVRLPIYPMKGYSVSFYVGHEPDLPRMSLTDQSKKIVYSRLGDIIRVAGTAEFAGYDMSVRTDRVTPIKEAAQALFPQLQGISDAHITSWACLRPSTPSGAPILGATAYENLYLNTGHGTLGWTLACGSAKIVTDVIMGKKPEIDLTGLTL
jgi:D-amino-acid dehydrogenase